MPSSVIRFFTYDEAKQRLRIVFQTTGTYDYFDVPEDLYTDFAEAESKGEFFNLHIRDRYRFEKKR